MPHALLRAPLLPARALTDASVHSPLLAAGIALASPALQEHADTRAAERRARYRRRAAFRATPHGLLAGVGVVGLDDTTTLALGTPRAQLDVPFARLASLGRAWLDDPEGWVSARLRIAPSVLVWEGRVSWLAFGRDTQAVRYEVLLEPWLKSLLARTQEWTLATKLVKRDTPVELLHQLVDDGLLQHDFEPPLVGPPPLLWAAKRMPQLASILTNIERANAAHDMPALAAQIAALPGTGAPLSALLVHEVQGSIARSPVEHAAQLAPSLFALNEALAPLDERVPGLDEALQRCSALVGEGVVPAAPLEHGAYGHVLGGAEARSAPRLEIITWLAGLVNVAARNSVEVVELTGDELATQVGQARCESFELHLAPCEDGWLLGLHAPAGSSWGRFAHGLGEPMTRALHELRALEQLVDGDVVRLDVAYAPTHELGDVCCVPPLRDAALAVSSWPEGGAVSVQQCGLMNEPASTSHRAIVAGDHTLRIAPLHRVRSTTAPPSVARVLLADSLRRQHAPWALTWGPLAELPWLPRVLVDGFVIAPQSWALPTTLEDEHLAAWRREQRVARFIQVGEEDVLLPIDLDSPAERAELRALAPTRAFEIWPPLGREVDASGRRVELICAVIDEDAPRRVVQRYATTFPPTPEKNWRTVQLYAPRDRHDELFISAVRLLDGKASAFYVLPYVDDAGEHLRVRVRDTSEIGVAGLASALAAALPAVTTSITPYHPEHARYGAALPAVEKIFEADTRFVADALELDVPRELLVVASFEALARGLGLTAAQVDARAHDAFAAYQVTEDDERQWLAPLYRERQRELAAIVAEPPPDHVARVRAAKLSKRHALELFPTLLHLAAVRLCGPVREREIVALYSWTRARLSRAARASQKH